MAFTAKINQLPPHVADLIAAGEVVERPGSVVKELTENAIDAGATAVTVEIQNGGITFIRVTDNGCGIANEEAIRELVKREQEKDLHNMADYFHGSAGAKAKLISAEWDVENVNGVLYGVIRTGLREPFSPAEEQEWIDELTGQAADGFGEGLEQREIKTEDGNIYVSFWHSGEDYFMENETDFRQRMSDNLGFEEQRIGGM